MSSTIFCTAWFPLVFGVDIYPHVHVCGIRIGSGWKICAQIIPWNFAEKRIRENSSEIHLIACWDLLELVSWLLYGAKWKSWHMLHYSHSGLIRFPLPVHVHVIHVKRSNFDDMHRCWYYMGVYCLLCDCEIRGCWHDEWFRVTERNERVFATLDFSIAESGSACVQESLLSLSHSLRTGTTMMYQLYSSPSRVEVFDVAQEANSSSRPLLFLTIKRPEDVSSIQSWLVFLVDNFLYWWNSHLP